MSCNLICETGGNNSMYVKLACLNNKEFQLRYLTCDEYFYVIILLLGS